MPFITKMDPPTYYGGYGTDQPWLNVVPMEDVVRGRLQHTNQQYDPSVNYADISYDYARDIPHLDMYNQLGLGAMGAMGVTKLQAAQKKIAAAKKKAAAANAAANPPTVNLPLAQPVRSSTMTAVVGGSIVAVAASIGLFLYLRHKGSSKKSKGGRR